MDDVYRKFSQSAGSPAIWFSTLRHGSDLPAARWLRDPLNIGILNQADKFGQKLCTTPSSVFGNNGLAPSGGNTFWSCVFHPNFTRDYRESFMTLENRTFLSTQNFDFNLETATNVTQFISKCLVAYCDSIETCKTPSCTEEQLVLNGTLLSQSQVSTCKANICELDPEKSSNPDIAGIGVLVSYCIQAGIAILSTVLLQLRRFRNIVLAALDEFQRAQCCFVVAVAVATAGAFNQMSHTDKETVSSMIVIGLLFTMVVQALLMVGNGLRHSHFTFMVTFCAWAFSLMARWLSRANGSATPRSPRPAACGHWPSSQTCGHTQKLDSMLRIIFYLPIPGMILLTVVHFWPVITRVSETLKDFWVKRVLKPYGSKLSHPAAVNFFAYICLSGYVLTGMFILAVVFLCGAYLFIPIAVIAVIFKNSRSDWSFGQIVAVTLWLPSLFSFIKDCIYAPLVGRTDQLPQTQKGVEVDDVHQEIMDTSVTLTNLDAAEKDRVGN